MHDPHLRRWSLDDAPAVLDAAATSPDLERQIGPVTNLDDARAVVQKYGATVEAGTGHVWAIIDESTVVGAVGTTAIERRHRTAWCWYWLAASARGRGLAARGLATAAVHAFDDDLFRLELAHRVDNPASRAVAIRAGFQAEGIERARLEYDGIRYDCETHARLTSDPPPELEPLPIRS